jgi:hypothetical protein
MQRPVWASSVCRASRPAPSRTWNRRAPRLATATAPAPGAKLLQDLTVAERFVDVAISATSNLLNGAVFGAFFGLISGAWTHRSLAGAWGEAKMNGRSWGSISGIYAGLQTAARVIRNKDDRFNNVIGACGSGAVFTAKGGPRAAVQGCVSFAGLSYLIDVFTAPKDAPEATGDQVLSDEAILRKKR